MTGWTSGWCFGLELNTLGCCAVTRRISNYCDVDGFTTVHPPAVGDCLSFSERCFYGQWINELSAILNLLISSYCPELMILLSVELDCQCPWGHALCRLHNPWFRDLTPKRSGRLLVKELESDAYLKGSSTWFCCIWWMDYVFICCLFYHLFNMQCWC